MLEEYVRKCITCQQNKYEALSPLDLQPLPIPKRVWEDISLDLIEGLPKPNGKSVVPVVVDCLSR